MNIIWQILKILYCAVLVVYFESVTYNMGVPGVLLLLFYEPLFFIYYMLTPVDQYYNLLYNHFTATMLMPFVVPIISWTMVNRGVVIKPWTYGIFYVWVLFLNYMSFRSFCGHLCICTDLTFVYAMSHYPLFLLCEFIYSYKILKPLSLISEKK